MVLAALRATDDIAVVRAFQIVANFVQAQVQLRGHGWNQAFRVFTQLWLLRACDQRFFLIFPGLGLDQVGFKARYLLTSGNMS